MDLLSVLQLNPPALRRLAGSGSPAGSPRARESDSSPAPPSPPPPDVNRVESRPGATRAASRGSGSEGATARTGSGRANVELSEEERASEARGFRPSLVDRVLGPRQEAAEAIPDELLAHPDDDMRPDADAIRSRRASRRGDQRGVYTAPGSVGVRSRRAGQPALGQPNLQAQASVGTDLAPEVQLSRATLSTDPDDPLGARRTHTTSATVGLDSVGVQRERRTGEGDSARTSTVGGRATVDPRQGITGMQVSGSSTFPGGIKVSTSFGYEVEISQPTADGERWKVEGEWTWTGNLGGGVSGRGAGASASIRVGQKRRFVKRFPSQPEAQRFRDSYGSWLGPQSYGNFTGVDSAAGAERMAVGDESATTNSSGGSLGGSVEVAGVQLGVTGSESQTHEFTVTRPSADAVRLKVRDTREAGVGATAGVGAMAGMGATASDGDLSGREVEFTLPAGRAALERALRTRGLPAGRSGPGWRETQRSRGDRAQVGSTASLLGVNLQRTETLDNEQVTDANGTRRRVTGTVETGAATVIPAWITDDTVAEEARQQIRVTSDRRDGTSLTVQADGSDARDTRAMLARAAGANPGGEAARGEDSGQWTLSSQLSENELRAFLRAVHSGRAERDRAELGTAADEGTALMAAVRSASNLDAARVAVVRFVNRTGTRGLAMIRAVLRRETGTAQPAMDVALEGSRVWEGEEGRRRVSGQIDGLEQRLGRGEDVARLQPEVERLYREQADRLRTMRSEGQHRDLPRETRTQQIALNEPLLARLDALRRRVGEAARGARARAEPDRATALRMAAGTAGQAESSIEAHQAEQAVASGSRNTLAALASDERRMREKRDAMNRLRTAALRERGVHAGGAGVHFARPAIEALPNLLNDFRAMYRDALSKQQAGDQAVALAQETIRAFEAERDRVPANGVLDATAAALVEELRRLAWRGHDELERARAAFAAAITAFAGIRAAVPAGERRQYFGGTQPPSL